MRKLTVPLAFAVAAALITTVLMSTVFSPAGFNAQTRTAGSYAGRWGLQASGMFEYQISRNWLSHW